MTDFSPYLEEQVFRHFFRGDEAGDEADRPTQYQMSLHNGDPSESGTDNEAAGSGYVRQPIVFAVPVDSSPTTISNSVVVEFEDMPAGSWSHSFLWGMVSSVWQPMGRGTFVQARTTTSGDTVRFGIGDVTYELD